MTASIIYKWPVTLEIQCLSVDVFALCAAKPSPSNNVPLSNHKV